MRKVGLVAMVGILLAAPAAFADFGTWNTYSVTPVNTLGSLDVDLVFTAGTAGDALTPAVDDTFYFLGQLYYPYPYPATTTSVISSAYVPRGNPANTSWTHTFAFTAPLETPTGVWGWWGFLGNLTPSSNYVYSLTTTAGTLPVTYNPNQPTPTPPPGGYGGNPIPTLSMPALLLLGGILMGVGVLLLRRR